MNLIAISIRRPVFAWILMSALIIFGAISANRLGVSQLPDIDFPVLTVSVDYSGASPEVIEADIIDPMEQRLLGVEGITSVRSSARQGSGSVTLEFSIDRNIDVALQEVQAAISQLRLPPEVDAPVISKTNPEDSPILFLGVYSERPVVEVLRWTDEFLLDQLRFIPGIGEVSIAGFSQRNIRVWPDPARLKAADLTVLDVQAALQTQHIETSAGQLNDGVKEYRTRWLGEVSSPEAIGEIRILRRSGANIQGATYRIKDVAKVEDGLSDIRRLARAKGQEAVAVSIRKMRGGNEVALAEAIAKKVQELQPGLPTGFNLVTNIDFTRPTSAVVSTTFEKLWMAAIVTILVCFLFLGNFSSAVNILFSIPTSIVGTFLVLYFSGFTLNLFTLLALTLAISIVVDDAIMLLENIVRHHKMGKSPAQAAYDGSIEILPAAMAATLAVVAVFAPVIFMSGVTGKFFFQFGITMSAAVLLSLLEAVTITPMRCAAFLSDNPKESRFEKYVDGVTEKWAHFYERILRVTLDWPWTIFVIATVLFAVSLLLVREVRQELVPPQDQDVIIVAGNLPPGTNLQVTSDRVRDIEKILDASPHVERYFVSVGAGGPASEVNQFFIPVYLKDRQKRKLTHLQIMDELRAATREIKGMRVSFRDLSARGLTAGRLFPVSFNLSGPDLAVLETKAQEIIAQLDSEGLTQDLDTDFKRGLPELRLTPNREAMAAFAVSVDNVAQTLSIVIGGNRNIRFTDDGKRYPVNIRVPEAEVRSLKDIEKIFVRNNFGNLIPLHQLVKAETKVTYQSIVRVNRQRSIGVFGNLKPGISQGAVLARAQEIAREKLPEGYSLFLDGSAAGLRESFRSLLIALLLGVVVAYMVLAVQFNSFVHPVTVLVALPFSVTGALLVLWIFGQSMNLFSFIGMIVLAGIAKKNSILLVEFTNQTRERGEKAVRAALLHACPVRLRPILMTSAATVAAALPLVIGDSIGQETRTPMGLTIIGGTIVSTLFTLIVVPSVYQLLAHLERKSRHRMEFTTHS